MNSMSRTAIVVDRLDSGLGIAATSRATLSVGIEVVPALNFPTPESLIRYLSENGFECALFSWREILFDLFSDFFLARDIFELRQRMTIGASIPDYQGLDENFSDLTPRERFILQNVDFYFVTNQNLAERYQELVPNEKFSGILHDIPNMEIINEIRSRHISRDFKQIIWVGNSQWGSRSGFVDYKGFHEVVLPILETLGENEGFKLTIVDSATNKIPNSQVLAEIARSRCLILTSVQEGTSLPILEALALGTGVITSNVGIASEIEHCTTDFQIVGRNPAKFIDAFNKLQHENSEESNMASFNRYLEKALSEIINPRLTLTVDQDFPKFRLNAILRVHVKWLLRYMKKLSKG